jgi:hypothetical protein
MRPTKLNAGRRPPLPRTIIVAGARRIAAPRKGWAFSGASSATGPPNMGARPSAFNAMILPVGPFVMTTTALAPAANAAVIGSRIGFASAEDQRANGRSTNAIAPSSGASARPAGSMRTSGPVIPSGPVWTTIGCGQSGALISPHSSSQRVGSKKGVATSCRSTLKPKLSSSAASQVPQAISPAPPACLLPKPIYLSRSVATLASWLRGSLTVAVAAVTGNAAAPARKLRLLVRAIVSSPS